MAPIKKKPILADKINSLLSAAPTNIVSDEENEDTKAKVVDHYEESDDSNVETTKGSKIRRQNAPLLDEIDKRYSGVKVSRKDIYEETDENDDDSDDVDAADVIKNKHEDSSDKDEEVNEDEGEEESEIEEDDEEEEEDASDDDEEQDIDRENPLYRERKAVADSNFKTMSRTNIQEEQEKGKCVQSQLKIWENLLEMRIRLQKCLIVGNRLPQYDNHKEFRKDIEFEKKSNEARSKLTMLLNSMLSLQAALWKQFPETKSLDINKTTKEASERDNKDVEDPMDEEIPSDSEGEDYDDNNENDEDNVDSDETSQNEEKDEELPKKKLKFSEYEKILDKRHKSYVNYRNSVISKWNDKTRVITGKINKTGSETTLKQIEFALSDMAKSRKRTQLKRSEYDIIGKSNISENDDGRRVQEYDTEIYDDDDFYHQLLRDLIEYKSADIIDPIQLSKQWIQLQSMRNKIKRKIDTRATKGRRVRYNVHNKLVNYMAPITINDTWTELAKNELYNSLFGKIAPAETMQR